MLANINQQDRRQKISLSSFLCLVFQNYRHARHGIMNKLFLRKYSIDSIAKDACLQCPFEENRPLEAPVSAEPLQTAVAHQSIQAIIDAHTASFATYLTFKTQIDQQIVVKCVHRCQEYADRHKH
jgi:hypothetical protein